MADPSSSEFSPTRVGGRYVLLDELGRGGMATVHRAYDEVLDRHVAVKILHPHLAADAAFLDRFRREARAAAALSHPNVVGVHDWGETDQGAYLVLQLVEGPTLRQILREHGPLTQEQAAGILIPVARGLGAAHAAGMVHRDVKPENLLLGRDGIIRVADFGLARAIASTNATFGTDVLIGSPHYLAPEAVEGEQLDPRADVYAMGIILFECLTGAPPHSAETAFATAMRHTTHTVPRPSTVTHGISPGVDDVVRWATAIDPSERYASGDDLARALTIAVPEVADPTTLDISSTQDVATRSTATRVHISVDDDRESDEHLWKDWQDLGGSAGAGASDLDHTAAAQRADREIAATSTQLVGAETNHEVLDAPWPDAVGPDDAHGMAQAESRSSTPDDASDIDVQGEDDEADVLGVWRRRPGWTATLVIIGLIVASGVGGYLLWDRLVAPVLPVPDVEGSTTDEAIEQLVAEGFDVEVAGHRHDLVAPRGTVLEFQPDDQARRGSTVLLVESAGPRQIEIADVRGERAADAVEQLRADGFEVELHERYDETVPEGAVVDLSPPAGSSVDEASTVTMSVSLGPAPIEVPAVVGVSVDDATRTLEDVDLQLEIHERRYHDEVPEGHIIAQEPDNDATLLPGETVSVTVSDGPQPIRVPSVRDIHIDEAIAQLRELGFEVEEDLRGGIGSFLQPGRVIDQTPSPGTLRLPGSTITVYAYER